MSAAIGGVAVSPVAMRWPVLDAHGAVRAWRADAPAFVPPATVLDLLGAAVDGRYALEPLLIDAQPADVAGWLEGRAPELAGCVLPVLSARDTLGGDFELAHAWVWQGRRFALRLDPGEPMPGAGWLAIASCLLYPASIDVERMQIDIRRLHASTPAEVFVDRALAPVLVSAAQKAGADGWVGPALHAGGFSATRASALRLLVLLGDTRTAQPAVVVAIESDALLTTHLLAWLGRAELHGYGEVSVAAAVRLLGFERLRTWAAALALAGEDAAAPVDALERALVRAALCAEVARLDARPLDRATAWLVGLLAELPLLTGLAMPQAVSSLGLTGELRAGLLDDTHPLGRLRIAVTDYQRGEWTLVRASGLGAVLADAYLGAVLAAGETLVKWRGA